MTVKQEGGVFILTEDYHGVYSSAVQAMPGRHRQSYAELAAGVFSRGYFYGDAYVHTFQELGISAEQSIPQCEYLQTRWAAENGVSFPAAWLDRFLLRGVARRVLHVNFLTQQEKLAKIVTAQIRTARPKILWVFSGVPVHKALLEEWRRCADKIVLWHSCPLWPDYPFKSFDAVFSCVPPLVDYFKENGMTSFLLPHAFDRRVLESLSLPVTRKPKAVFIGSTGEVHRQRMEFLDKLAREVEMDYFGPHLGVLPPDSPLRKNYRGPAWGRDLYAAYGSYAVTVHLNIDVAQRYPSAKRLYESTGMGICLVTNKHEQLTEYFVPEAEVVTFDDFDECAVRIQSLLANPRRAGEIGKQGQARTLRDHTYGARVQKFLTCCRDDLGVRL